ncbi:lipoprotein NlpI [Cesiribacter andamanensis AMV16]|uniref:Lipoprotein NlpI n=1 Tax=Cesiribacter andamanensis AMV16 TaxID=1279009 RepID=M7MZW7_9BACT|nr:lipoprotein NlpI [Cesiribacter andamanensis AMV16]
MLRPESSRQPQTTDAAIARSWQAFDTRRVAELLQQAQQAEQARAYDKARTLYRQALQLQPGDAPTQARLRKLEQKISFNTQLEAKFKEGAYLEAIQAYGKAISEDPKNADLYLGRGRAYEKLKDFGAAIGDFSTAIKLDPQFAQAYHQRALLYERSQDAQKALADYDHIIQKLPNGAAYYPERARLKQAMGDGKGALADYEAALKQTPDEAALHYQKGLLLQQQKAPEAAIAAFSKALSLDSLLAPAYYARGLAYMEQQNISAAAVDFEQARSGGLSPGQLAEIDALAREHYQAGEQALAKGNARLALQHMIKAVLIAPSNEQAWVLKGDAHYQLKDYDNALQSYSRAIELERPSLAYYKRGLVLREQGEFPAAKADFARFVPIGAELVAAAETGATTAQSAQALEQVAQEVAEGWYRLGNAQLLAEQYLEAQASLDKAMAINKTHAQALFAQGAVQLGLKNYKRAIRDIEKSMKWGIPDNPWVYLALGDAYQALGQTEYALSIYTYILEKVDGAFAPAYLQRSDSYKQLKQYPRALQDITKALTLHEAFGRDVGLLTRKGLLELHEARYQEAGQTFEQALQLENTNAWALYGKASVLASQNKLEESLELYRRAFQTGLIEWSAIKDDPIIRQVSKQKAFQELVDASFRL